MDPSPLLPAPSRLVHERGIPAFGMYQGTVGMLSWQPLTLAPWHRLTRKLHHKRWQYAAFAHDNYFIGVAVVDLGWCSTAFAYLFDRQKREVTASFSADGLPGLSAKIEDRAFGHARFCAGGGKLVFTREAGRMLLEVRTPALRIAAHITLAPEVPTLCAIAPANHLAHSTHKTGGLSVSGYADTNGSRYSLDGAIASLDASNGLLARHTAWRWASAHNHELGFNLQDGYMGDAENAIWLHGKLLRVGKVRFDYSPADPMAPWHIHSDDGLVDLRFTPEGIRSENKNLLIAASRYVQPIGTFSGVLLDPASGARHIVSALTGVTEDHASRW
ncbi:DUF2804 domain-containing protein [Aquitalea sp. S1-19]|nr:DUF2804 domain-containing protein [Aquitalea sp. S1-19]